MWKHSIRASVISVIAAFTASAIACSAENEGDKNPGISGGGAGGTSGAGGVGATGGVAGVGGASGTGGMNAAAGVGGMPPAGAGGVGGGTGGAGGVGGGTDGAGGVGGGEVIAGTKCGDADCWTYLGRDTHSTFFNPNETKISVATAGMLTMKWSASTNSTATGTAAVVGDTVYFDAQAHTFAFDRATGALRWTQSHGGSGSITYDNGKLFVQRARGSVLRLDAATGNTDWATPDNGPGNSIGTPFVVGNKVLVGTSSSDEWGFGTSDFIGRVTAFDKDTGDVLWTFNTIQSGGGNGAPVWSSQSADVEAGMAFLTTGNNYHTVGGDSDSIVALNLDTGEKLWQFQATPNDIFNGQNLAGLDHDFGANPIVFTGGGVKMVGAGSKSGTFFALDRMTGDELWRREVTKGCPLGGILNNGAYDGQRIYVSSFPCDVTAFGSIGAITPLATRLVALNPANGDVLWEKDLGDNGHSWGPLTVANGVLFVPSQNKMLALDAANGNELFAFTAQGSICSGAVVVDGEVYFGAGVPPADTLNMGGSADGTTFYALHIP